MKRFSLIPLALLLLCGCTSAPRQEIPATEIPTTVTTEAPVVSPVGFYDPESTLEAATNGALQVYPLYRSDVTHIVPMDSGILVFSGETTTTLTLLAGDDLYVKATGNLNCLIQPDDPAVQVSAKGVTYYDASTRELVFLDAELREGTRVPMPEDMVGTPALSANRKKLYYSTENALRVVELDSGLNMLLREMASNDHRITGLHCSDMVVSCQATDPYGTRYTIFLSAENGRTLQEMSDPLELTTKGSRYFARHQEGIYAELLTGTINEEIFLLNTGNSTSSYPVLDLESILLLTDLGQDGTTLEFCNLESGKRTNLLESTASLQPESVIADPDRDSLLMLCYDETYECDILCRWILSRSTVADDRSYFQPRYTAENPDLETLNQLRIQADALEQRHDVKLFFWTDALGEASADLLLEAEYHAPAVAQWLADLDQMLSIYPSGFLGKLKTPPKICLVRSFEAKNPGEDLSCLLHLDQNVKPYIFVTMDDNWQTDFKHQLFHVIETYVLTTSSAFDSWSSLNPKGFNYTLQFSDTVTDAIQPHLESGAFINLYATSFPKEDRAMTMIAALESGNESSFQNKVMQSKLKLLCNGIRKAFGYRKSPEVFLWEQYLK